MTRRSLWVWAAAAVLLAGCERLHHTETFTVPANQAKSVYALPIITSDEKFTITAEAPAPDGQVAIYLVPSSQKEANDAIDLIEKGTTDDKLILAKSDKGPKVTLEATLHANDDFNLVIQNFGKEPADVKVTIIGK
jgi:hypothetical protein